MIITRKPSFFTSSLPTLTNDNSPLELVSSFKYLEVIISSGLSTLNLSAQSWRTIGLIYHHFYHHSPLSVLLKFYLSLILPHLTYCSSVWSPPSSSLNSRVLDRLQYFALKMCMQKWSSEYSSLLLTLNLPSLSAHHDQAKLLLLFKINHNYFYFPPYLIVSAPSPPPIFSSL